VTEWYRVAVSKTTMDDVGGDVDSDCTAGCVRDTVFSNTGREGVKSYRSLQRFPRRRTSSSKVMLCHTSPPPRAPVF
jgi:hypothetical protein